MHDADVGSLALAIFVPATVPSVTTIAVFGDTLFLTRTPSFSGLLFELVPNRVVASGERDLVPDVQRLTKLTASWQSQQVRAQPCMPCTLSLVEECGDDLRVYREQVGD